MIARLPRQMLWTDFSTIDRFYKIETLNKHFHEVLKGVDISPFEEKKDDTKVFNEVYYQLTRMAYERAMPADLSRYEADVRGNMGLSYGVELVMTMLYFLMSLADKNSRLFNSFLLLTIKERYGNCIFWKPFGDRYERLSKSKKRLRFDFKPRPIPANELADKYVHWQEITRDYDTGALLEILSLWNSKKDRLIIFELIKSSVNFKTPKLQQTFYNQVSSILKSNLFGKDKVSEGNSELENRLKELDTKLLILQRENAVFQNLTRELQSENEKLKSMFEEKKQDGAARKFTLVEMVNHCKSCVEWDDVKDIVRMLNKLLRGVATKEDYDLLDSIETEFRNRKYGKTYIKEQTVIPHVGNYRPEIQKQTMNVPFPAIKQDEQNILE